MQIITSVLLLVIALAGCASVPNSDATLNTKEGAAVVYGQGGRGVGVFIQGVLPTLTHTKIVRLTQIDGKWVEPVENKTEYWIKPGKYRLRVICELRFEIYTWSGNKEIEADLEAGKEYVLDARKYTAGDFWGKRSACAPFISEKNNA